MEHTELYKSKEVALYRAKDLRTRFEYVCVIKDQLRQYWIHTSPQCLDNGRMILELK